MDPLEKLYQTVIGKGPHEVMGDIDTSTPQGVFRDVWIDPNKHMELLTLASEVLKETPIQRALSQNEWYLKRLCQAFMIPEKMLGKIR